jgi:hypothetical protein
LAVLSGARTDSVAAMRPAAATKGVSVARLNSKNHHAAANGLPNPHDRLHVGGSAQEYDF